MEFNSFEQVYENNAGNDLVIVTRRQNLEYKGNLPKFNVSEGICRVDYEGHTYDLVQCEGHDFPGWGGSWRGVVRDAPDSQTAYEAAKEFFESDQCVSWSW